MACSDMEKLSLDVEPYCDSDLSGCAAAMEKERESYLSPTESTSTISVSASIPPDQQGYDVEFDPPLESKYECPICLMGLRSAVQTPCGHRFCNSCIKKSIRDTGQKCPVDNEVLLEEQLFPDNFAKREILSLTVRCPNEGCSDKMELRQLEKHSSQCKFATVQCPQCLESVRKSHLDEHKSEQCSQRRMTCPACAGSFVFANKQIHEQICPFANTVCEYCEMELIRDQLALHCDTDCLKAPVACTFSTFGCHVKMPRNELAQHMQEFTQMHMRCMAEFLRSQTLSSCPVPSVNAHSSSDERGASARAPDSCQCRQELMNLRETVLELEGRLVRQDQQIRELCIHNETQKNQVTELRRKLSTLEEATRELEAQQYQGVYVWRLENFSLHLRNQEAGQPIVLHSPPFYTGRPGYKLCLRLHLQTPSAPRCSNYISLFVHTMQGEFDSQLSWPLQGMIRLAVLDQVEGQHHVEVMETKPDLQAFQRPTVQRNPKGFGYVTFLHLQALRQRGFMKDDVLLVRCEVTPRFDASLRREGVQPRGSEPSL
ncbi:TNF receptor-associated factor 6 [Carassius carassius]|uniref:TNF receptor-associated factor 6 n=1 Tax=Carassius carassius TaxID=217509 RepID=UPI0028691611|nr:TNF receptor-associated factor 6 [Carassius carassius]XP_059390508.1 TNF receptor-associated factor 6 [Carassius carassius]